jgi:dTDP-4-dehydrorhamnose reductase
MNSSIEPTIVLFGSGGRIGSLFYNYFPNIRAVKVSRIERDGVHSLRPFYELSSDIRILLGENRHFICVYLAGLSVIDDCKRFPDLSYALNVSYPEKIIKLFGDSLSSFLYASSEYVYDGSDSEVPFAEGIRLEPKSVYGRHKYEAELRLLDLSKSVVHILRLGKILNGVQRKENILFDTVKCLHLRRDVYAAIDQVFSPYYYKTLFKVCEFLFVNVHESLILNIGSDEPVSRYELLSMFLKSVGIDKTLIPCEIRSLALFDDVRTKYLGMNTSKCRRLTNIEASPANIISSCAEEYLLYSQSDS